MISMDEIYQFIMDNRYLKLLAILLIAVVIAVLVKIVMKRLLKPLVEKTKTIVDDIIIQNLSALIFYIIVLVGLRIGVSSFELKTANLNKIIDTFLILIVVRMMIKMINNFAQHWMTVWKDRTDARAEERLIPFLQKILKAVVFILGIIFIFNAWKVNISPLLATAGIAGLAIGLAVKDSLNNVLGGLQLVLDKTFKVGDKVKLDSGELGVIMDIGLRSTKLKTYDNEVIFIPNGLLANSKIKNYTEPDLTMRANVHFGVEYGSDPKEVERIVIEAIKKIELVLDDPKPSVQFLEMADFSLNFVARAWVEKYSQAYSVKIEMTSQIYSALDEANINIPFPTHTVSTKPSA